MSGKYRELEIKAHCGLHNTPQTNAHTFKHEFFVSVWFLHYTAHTHTRPPRLDKHTNVEKIKEKSFSFLLSLACSNMHTYRVS